jgi:hypothetical protein
MSKAEKGYFALHRTSPQTVVIVRMRIDLSKKTTDERRTLRTVYAGIGIPILWLILFAFAKRRRAICLQEFGPEACHRSWLSYPILLFAIFISFLGILKTKRLPEPSKGDSHPK